MKPFATGLSSLTLLASALAASVPAWAQAPTSEPAQSAPAPLTPAAPEQAPSGIPQSGSATQAAPGNGSVPPASGETSIEAAEPSAAAAAAPGAAPDFGPQPAEAVAAISPFVGDAQVLGPWTAGDRRGIWRTIMLQSLSDVAGNRFFVQQIEVVDGAPAVSSTTEITEVAEIDGAVVGYRVDEPSPDQPEQLTLFMDIVPLDGEISETYELFFTQGEPYIFGPASN